MTPGGAGLCSLISIIESHALRSHFWEVVVHCAMMCIHGGFGRVCTCLRVYAVVHSPFFACLRVYADVRSHFFPLFWQANPGLALDTFRKYVEDH